MKRWLLTVGLCLPLMAMANEGPQCATTVAMNLSAKQWLKINRVNVSVNVHATTQADSVPALQAEIMSTLATLHAGATWHLVALDQAQNASGLMAVNMMAVANIEISELPNIYAQVDKVSKTGMKLQVDSVDYVPGKETRLAAENALKAEIYQQTLAQVEALTLAYGQQFSVQQVDFNAIPSNRPGVMMAQGRGASSASSSVASSRELQQTARVSFAAGCEAE